MHRNSFSLAALAAAAVPGLVPAQTTPIATPVEDLDVAGVVGEDSQRVVVRSPASTAAGVRLDRDLTVADALTGTPLRGVANYQDIYKLTYLRGPSGILVMLAQEVKGH